MRNAIAYQSVRQFLLPWMYVLSFDIGCRSWQVKGNAKKRRNTHKLFWKIVRNALVKFVALFIDKQCLLEHVELFTCHKKLFFFYAVMHHINLNLRISYNISECMHGVTHTRHINK